MIEREKRLWRGSFLVFLVIASGCKGREGNALQYSQPGDSFQTQVVTLSFPVEDLRPVGTLDSLPDFRVGSLDGDRADAFGSIQTARSLPNGTVLVADGQALQLLLFDSVGQHLVTFGRRGGGPGEFYRLSSIPYVDKDSIWVFDSRAQRLSVFGSDGTFSHSVALGSPSFRRVSKVGRLGDGRLVTQSPLTPRGGAPGTSLIMRRDSSVIDLVHPDGSNMNQVAVVPTLESAQEVSPSGSGRLVTLPFGRKGLYVVSDRRVVGGFNDRFEIRWFDLNGNLGRITRFPAQDRPLTAGDVRRIRNQLLDRPGLTPEARTTLLSAFDAFPHPEIRPPFDEVRASHDGGVWVRVHRYWAPEGLSRWLLLDGHTGGIPGYLDIPEQIDVFEFGEDYVLGSVESEIGVPEVVRYRWR